MTTSRSNAPPERNPAVGWDPSDGMAVRFPETGQTGGGRRRGRQPVRPRRGPGVVIALEPGQQGSTANVAGAMGPGRQDRVRVGEWLQKGLKGARFVDPLNNS